jgi:hypothetical protein
MEAFADAAFGEGDEELAERRLTAPDDGLLRFVDVEPGR